MQQQDSVRDYLKFSLYLSLPPLGQIFSLTGTPRRLPEARVKAIAEAIYLIYLHHRQCHPYTRQSTIELMSEFTHEGRVVPAQ